MARSARDAELLWNKSPLKSLALGFGPGGSLPVASSTLVDFASSTDRAPPGSPLIFPSVPSRGGCGGKPQVIPIEDHEVVYERVAAVDVARCPGWCACAPRTRPAGPVRDRIWDNVPATRARIAELGRELLSCQVQMVTLESTSDYWRVWYRRA